MPITPTVYIVVYNNTFTGIEGVIVRVYLIAVEACAYCESANRADNAIEHWFIRSSAKEIKAFRVKEGTHDKPV